MVDIITLIFMALEPQGGRGGAMGAGTPLSPTRDSHILKYCA